MLRCPTPATAAAGPNGAWAVPTTSKISADLMSALKTTLAVIVTVVVIIPVMLVLLMMSQGR